MMIVLAPQTIHMQRRPTRLGKTLQTMRNHLRAQIPNLLPSESQLRDAVRTIAQVDDGAGQRLVEGAVGGAEPSEAFGAGERGLECSAQSEESVFGGVVVVDVEVADAAEGEGPSCVLGEGVDHVVEEADAGVDGYGLGG